MDKREVENLYKLFLVNSFYRNSKVKILSKIDLK